VEPQTEQAFVSVVVPAWNAERTIERCLTALFRQTMPRDRFEVIVVDDASTDHTAALAADLGARVVRLEKNGGPGAARNAGIEAARGPLIVFTDADCEPEPAFLAELAAPLADPMVGGSKGTYLSRQTSLVARFVQLEYEDRYRVTSRDRWIDFVDTYAACFRKADLEKAGGFDVRLRQCQDQELSFRLAEQGVGIRFAPEARTFHTHAELLGGYLWKKAGIAFWKVSVLRRHPRKLLKDSHTPQTLKLEMLLALAALTLSVQAALAAVVAPALASPAAAAAITSTLATFAALATLGFLALALPFSLRAFRRDPAVGLAAPGILWLRDLALAYGLAQGLRRAPRLDGPGPSALPPGPSAHEPGPPGRREPLATHT